MSGSQAFQTVDVSGPLSLNQAASIGNGIPSNNAVRVFVATGSTTMWENAVTVQLENTMGGTQPKVGIYSAIAANAGPCGSSWAGNMLTYLAPGCNMSVAHQVLELDFDNSSGTHSGDSGFGVGPLTAGLQISGAGANRIMCAECILGNIGGTAPLWNYGIVASNNSIAQTFIADFTDATTSIDIQGSHHTGIDMSNASISGPAILLANSQPIVAQPGIGLIEGNISNQVLLGMSGAAAVVPCAPILPINDDVLSCGGPAARWNSVWAVNGTIQTSDPALKEDISPLPSMTDVVQSIDPITFRWKGGHRTHWGFSAVDVRDVFADFGMDFGGYVLAEDGKHCLRPDQMIPVLWKAVQEMAEDLRELKSK